MSKTLDVKEVSKVVLPLFYVDRVYFSCIL